MKFLDEIKKYKKSILKKKIKPLEALIDEAKQLNKTPGLFVNALRNLGIGLIAEIKLASPSKGDISLYTVDELARIYGDLAVDCVSVLTEDKYFKGSLENIKKVKSICSKPVLMKDFIISEYQIYEGVISGADAVLLIAAMLTKKKLQKYLEVCKSLSISALVEVHSEKELKKCLGVDGLEIIGVNSRNLKTLETDDRIHDQLADMIPSDIAKVAESGINSKEDVKKLYNLGYDAVLVGRMLVSSKEPGIKIKEIKSVRKMYASYQDLRH